MIVNNIKLNEALEKLPEIYQPIYGYEEIRKSSSRKCADRLTYIEKIYDSLKSKLGRDLKVLDIGCAQGYFSLNIASWGGEVTGIDYLDKNIEVCKLLAKENESYRIYFVNANIEDYIKNIVSGEFDLVLGLSVFHHLCHSYGIEFVIELIRELATKISTGIFELAIKAEQLYWADSLPDDPEELLEEYDYIYKLAEFTTHLSDVKRPLYVASKKYAYFDEKIILIDQVLYQAHNNNGNCFKGTRRYFLGENLFIKKIKKGTPNDINIGIRNCEEIENERIFLEKMAGKYGFPRIEYFEENEDMAILVRDSFPGKLLSEIISEKVSFDEWDVIKQVLLVITQLEKEGLYYRDLRTWNLIYDGAEIRFIDYGDIGKEITDCAWPYNSVLSFFIFMDEVLNKKTRVFPVRNVAIISCISKWLDADKVKKILSLEKSNHVFEDIFNILFDENKEKECLDTIGIDVLKAYESLFDCMIDNYNELVRTRNEWEEILNGRNALSGKIEEELGRISAIEQCWIIRLAVKLALIYHKLVNHFRLNKK